MNIEIYQISSKSVHNVLKLWKVMWKTGPMRNIISGYWNGVSQAICDAFGNTQFWHPYLITWYHGCEKREYEFGRRAVISRLTDNFFVYH